MSESKKRKVEGEKKKRRKKERKSQGRYEPKSLRFAGAFPFEHAGGSDHRSHIRDWYFIANIFEDMYAFRLYYCLYFIPK